MPWRELVDEFDLNIGDQTGTRVFLEDPAGPVPSTPQYGSPFGGYYGGDRLGGTISVGGVSYNIQFPCTNLNFIHPGKHPGKVKVICTYGQEDQDGNDDDDPVTGSDSEAPGNAGTDKRIRNGTVNGEMFTHIVPASVDSSTKWYASDTAMKAGQRVHKLVTVGGVQQPIVVKDFPAFIAAVRTALGKVNTNAWMNGVYPPGTVLFVGAAWQYLKNAQGQHRWEAELSFKTREVTGGNGGGGAGNGDLNGANDGWNFIWNPELKNGRGDWDSPGQPVLYSAVSFAPLDALAPANAP